MGRAVRKPWNRRTATIAAVAGVLIGGTIGSGQVNAQTPDDPVVLRELLERGLSADGAPVELLVGKLPSLKPGVSVPTGWRLVGTIVRPRPPGIASAAPQGSVTVYLDAPMPPNDALTKLAAELSASGWRRLEVPSFTPGGFRAGGVALTANLFLCATEGLLIAAAAKAAEAVTSKVTLTILSGPGVGSSCSTSAPVTSFSLGSVSGVYGQLPTVALPSEWKVVFTGGGPGSPFTASSQATVEGTPSPSEALAILEPQLASVGWKRIGGANDAVIGSSVWRKTVDTTEYQAVVSVLAALGPERRSDLSIIVSTRADPSVLPYGVSPPPLMSPPIASPVAPTMTMPRTVATKTTATTKKRIK